MFCTPLALLHTALDAAKEQIAWGMAQADILKISDNEILWFTSVRLAHKSTVF
jgi:hypothetical protein